MNNLGTYDLRNEFAKATCRNGWIETPSGFGIGREGKLFSIRLFDGRKDTGIAFNFFPDDEDNLDSDGCWRVACPDEWVDPAIIPLETTYGLKEFYMDIVRKLLCSDGSRIAWKLDNGEFTKEEIPYPTK